MFRSLVLVSSALLFVAGCGGDSPPLTADMIAEDSAFAAEVLSAKGENVFAMGTDTVDTVEALEPPVVVAQQPPPPPSPAVIAPAQRPVTMTALATPRAAVKQTRVTRARLRPPAADREPAGIVSPGSALTLVSNQRACNPGDSFRATVVSGVRGSNGVMIPQGAQAIAQVGSSDKWGAGISVRVMSVRIGGRSYPISSRVGYVLPDRSGCIRERARIDVETSAPLRVASMLD